MCGRPLGLRRFKENQFVTADYVFGIVLIDFEKGKKNH